MRKFKILSIFLIYNGYNINMFYLLNLANVNLFRDPNKAPRLLLFLLHHPLFLLSDLDILLHGFIDFPMSLKSRDLRLNSLILGEHLLLLGVKTAIIRAMTPPSCDT